MQQSIYLTAGELERWRKCRFVNTNRLYYNLRQTHELSGWLVCWCGTRVKLPTLDPSGMEVNAAKNSMTAHKQNIIVLSLTQYIQGIHVHIASMVVSSPYKAEGSLANQIQIATQLSRGSDVILLLKSIATF
jgi:hypothetical protein